MVSDPEDYHEFVLTDGPFKRLFKWVKTSLKGQGLGRVFLTGVLPMVMSDVTSGMNVTRNVYLKPALADSPPALARERFILGTT